MCGLYNGTYQSSYLYPIIEFEFKFEFEFEFEF